MDVLEKKEKESPGSGIEQTNLGDLLLLQVTAPTESKR
jgi:hypothetical protein